jgi:hypothetical protein
LICYADIGVVKIRVGALITSGVQHNKKRGRFMHAEDFFRVISEVEFICDDINELKERIDLTKSEYRKITQAITSIENARKILTALFPTIKSLNNEIREDLAAEYADI